MKYLIIIVFVFCSVETLAQKTYSITIDSDDDQFFSVATGKKNYPSSSIGHLVISGLKDSIYKLLISFPRSSFEAETFSIDINSKDHVYQLKKNADKTWSLFDIQTKLTLSPGNALSAPSFSNDTEARKSREAFAQLMASVVNDTSVLNAPVEFVAETRKPDPKPAVVKKATTDSSAAIVKTERPEADSTLKKAPPVTIVSKDSLSRKKDSSVLAVKKKDSAQVHKPPVITRIDEQSTDSSRNLVFVDRYEDNKKADTIQVIIPVDTKPVPVNKDSVPATVQQDIDRDSVSKTTDSLVKASTNASSEKANDTITVIKIADSLPPMAKKDSLPSRSDSALKKEITVPLATDTTKRLQVVNSDCRNFATEAEVDKLRVKMLAENNLEERIQVAKKVFRSRCFTTRQIRALTELFPSDKTRYEFFDAAYPFVSDSYNFRTLSDMLTDEYYLGRFRAMVRM